MLGKRRYFNLAVFVSLKQLQLEKKQLKFCLPRETFGTTWSVRGDIRGRA